MVLTVAFPKPGDKFHVTVVLEKPDTFKKFEILDPYLRATTILIFGYKIDMNK